MKYNMELTVKVTELISDINRTHRYSMSRIYGIYNEVFGVAETPQSCASCLIRKVNQLKTWLNLQSQANEPTEKAVTETPITKKKGRPKLN